jgi:hypothetical protein
MNDNWYLNLVFVHVCSVTVHCKKRLAVSPSPAGMSLTNLFLYGNKKNYSRPGRVWLVTSRLGTGKWQNFFLQCSIHLLQICRHIFLFLLGNGFRKFRYAPPPTQFLQRKKETTFLLHPAKRTGASLGPWQLFTLIVVEGQNSCLFLRRS